MLIGAVLMFLPGLFLYFVLGYNDVPFSAVIAFAAFYIPMAGIGQLTEHLRYYPMMGSATTYIGYLAGSGATLRMPVAQSCVAAVDEPLLSAKGQIVAIVGVVTSVVVNIVILVLIVIFGNSILAVIPDAVRGAFSYITMAIFGYLLTMNLKANGRGDIVKGIVNIGWPLGVAAAGYVIFKVLLKSIPVIQSYAMLWILLFAMAVFIIRQLIIDKNEAKKAA